ncbi:Aromatic-ring-hydroxylating dioxygenase, alpha subunit [Penicillium griseofulvum]|uniref:Choline monooxygenase, chloroplastic n=1 Tax=Penicillium patulum TaxID=5078 RepID=A0A135LWQ4_PENPA|nr:Aromatic-ring-hydroxylating dioxygenase, alpha subunit [Penicillium griseofulvum]KXG53394.1 Aromatic-ring-hydroxylating dioxygenase, alpha subunit [Penicillium griseofulvum]
MLKNYLGLGGAETSPSPADDNSPAHPLPASWYSSQDIHELERRAIFSRKWLLTTHKLRFPKTGDWLRYDIAGYAFILVKDREGNINAFHNICRHRAFPVVTEEGGSSGIFSCQYHGWSYGLNGKLAKAPGYQDLQGFDKSKNGLLPIHVHIDVNGFIWLNLDAGEKPEISWEDEFKGIDLQPRFDDFNFDDYNFDHAWEMSGEYNWKILADNYNESYGPSISNHSSDAADTIDGNSTTEEVVNALKIASTYYFPNAVMTVLPNFFVMQRIVSTSPTTCSVRYEVYRHTDSNDEEFETINETYKRIMSEHNDICVETQKNLNSGALVNAQPHSRAEEGPVYFQKVVRDLIMGHHKREEDAGEEIWPARQRMPKEEAVSKEDMDFCSKLTRKDGSALTSGGCCGGGCGGGPPTIEATAPETMVV